MKLIQRHKAFRAARDRLAPMHALVQGPRSCWRSTHRRITKPRVTVPGYARDLVEMVAVSITDVEKELKEVGIEHERDGSITYYQTIKLPSEPSLLRGAVEVRFSPLGPPISITETALRETRAEFVVSSTPSQVGGNSNSRKSDTPGSSFAPLPTCWLRSATTPPIAKSPRLASRPARAWRRNARPRRRSR